MVIAPAWVVAKNMVLAKTLADVRRIYTNFIILILRITRLFLNEKISQTIWKEILGNTDLHNNIRNNRRNESCN